jgi:hypothetical protein
MQIKTPENFNMQLNGATKICLLLLMLHFSKASSQSAREVAVEITATNNGSNTVLHWKADTGVLRYFIFQRIHSDSNWLLLDSLPASIQNYEFKSSVFQRSMEFKVSKRKNNFSFLGNGYITAGFGLTEKVKRGKILVLVDSNLISPLATELFDYREQLENEGYTWVQKSVLQTDSVTAIKSWIFNQWKSDSSGIVCALLLGHIPVPYSGDMSPDGHAEHRGAWPADAYYGSFYANWSDLLINRSTAARAANRNVPNDGKFDLSRLNNVGTTWKNTRRYQLPVGRIDFFDMPMFGSVTQLMKRYIRKNLAFRTGRKQFKARALVDDNFGYFSGEAFASGGYRNFSTFFGDSILNADYSGTGSGMKSTDYLWSYGCGGGSYTSCSGVISSTDFVNDSLLNPFTMLFGSYFGDWDNQNNLLRAPLASKGWGLTNVWSGRPYWMIHEAALGSPFYQCIKTTINCTNIYNVGSNGSGVHLAFMGDPTLRVYPVANIFQLNAQSNCTGIVSLKWDLPPDAPDSIIIEILKSNQWQLLMSISGSDTQWLNKFSAGRHTFSVRAKKLMRSASGTWWDLGARSMIDVSVNLSDTPSVIIDHLRKCVGDSFQVTGLWKMGSALKSWKLNGENIPTKDSVWKLAAVGQGLVSIGIVTQTDSGCVSFDSVILNSPPADVIEWLEKTDSSISVSSKLQLPLRWYRNDTLLGGVDSSVFKSRQSGIFRVCTISPDSCEICSDTLNWIYRPVINGAIELKKVAISLYPNPATLGLRILGILNDKDCNWVIYDVRGLSIGEGIGTSVDVSYLSDGCYLLSLSNYGTYWFIKR